jgi:hypothetical protein
MRFKCTLQEDIHLIPHPHLPWRGVEPPSPREKRSQDQLTIEGPGVKEVWREGELSKDGL